MNYNALKLGAATIIALACIVALILDADGNYVWAAPALSGCLFYAFGNAKLTAREGNTAPIISTK